MFIIRSDLFNEEAKKIITAKLQVCDGGYLTAIIL
jgi:hypothetical protein